MAVRARLFGACANSAVRQCQRTPLSSQSGTASNLLGLSGVLPPATGSAGPGDVRVATRITATGSTKEFAMRSFLEGPPLQFPTGLATGRLADGSRLARIAIRCQRR